MKTFFFLSALIAGALLSFRACAAVFYVNANNANPTPPYLNWATAATNIQDAVSLSAAGDTVWVTNGIYQFSGGPDSSGNSNRVFVASPNVTLQSVNGPAATIIQGYQVPGTTNGSAAVRCVYLSRGSTLCGFTLTNGATGWNASSSGGGVCGQDWTCSAANCVITGNAALNLAGGAENCTLINCLLTSNITFSAVGGAADDCQLFNCTVANNFSPVSGSGSFAANSILYDNNDNLYAQNIPVTNCCVDYSYVAYAGTNAMFGPPPWVNESVGDYHLALGSRCIGAGNTNFVYTATDLDGNPRIVGGAVDLGAYQSDYTNVVHYVSLRSPGPVPPYTNWSTAAATIQQAISVAQSGEVVVADWTDYRGYYNSSNTVIYGQEGNRIAITNAITVVGLYGPASTTVTGAGGTRCAYVGSNAVLIGFTLANGQGRQTGGDLIKEQSGGGAWCEVGGVISNCIVGGEFGYYNNNVYGGYGAGVYGGTIYNSTITGNYAQSGGGAAASATLYNCTLSYNETGTGAYQCALYDCTIANNSPTGAGATQCTLSNCTVSASSGNGVSQSVLYNCTVTGSTSAGASQCTLYDCTLIGNTNTGASQSTLHNCTATGNLGGGASGCTNYNCTFAFNSGGGGASGGISYNCILSTNTRSFGGGGAIDGTLYNCLIKNNSGVNGGDAYGCTLYNCTITGNSAGTGGGVVSGTLYNCIIYSNSSPNGANYANSTLNYCDTTPLPTNGVGNISSDPAFVNPAGGNFHVSSNSPCINSGDNAYVTVTNDLDGNARIVGGTVDMGAYEYQTPSSVISYAYLQQYGLPTDGSVDFADLDGTPFTVYQDWIAGLNPTNPASVLVMLPPAASNNTAGITVTWQSVSGITYFLQSSTNLTAQPAFSTIQTNLLGQPGTTSYTDTTATNPVPYFYRVGVQ
ncbi:MAG: right-handed parallel beta-helix repeat-containing protein [Verrucomicrobiota bacterium]|jgi:hypothetical protein